MLYATPSGKLSAKAKLFVSLSAAWEIDLKILVTFALENEFAPWRKLRKFKRVSVDSWDKTFAARVGDADVRVVLTGAGRFAAQRAMDRAFAEVPDACIVSGLAGALKPDYLPGQVLAARTAANLTGTRVLRSDAELVSRAVASGVKVADTILVSERVIATAREKQQLGVAGDAVDMESLWVLAAAERQSVRAVVIRAISDSADANLPLDFDRIFDKQGNVSFAKVIGQIARKPRRIIGLLRLANDSQRAAGALAMFLESYIQDLSSQPLDEIAKAEALVVN
jgi:adenosylhomocysteine nucleosidase